MAANLKKEIAGLQRRLSRISTNGAGSRQPRATAGSRRRRRRASRPNPNNIGSSPTTVIAPRVQYTNPRPSGTASDGKFRVTRTEYFKDVDCGKYGTFFINPKHFTGWVAGIAGHFERYKMHKCIFHYKAASGTNQSGYVLLGVDWNLSKDPTSASDARTKAAASTPVFQTPIWQSGKFVLPKNRLMSRKELLVSPGDSSRDANETVAMIVYYFGGPTSQTGVGTLWIEYDFEFFGTSA